MTLDFRPEGIRRLAEIAWQVNEKTENIGARRLYTVMEKLLEDVSFDAGKRERPDGRGRCRLRRRAASRISRRAKIWRATSCKLRRRRRQRRRAAERLARAVIGPLE